MADLPPGDEVSISGPFDSGYYEGENRAVVLAGESGVGPAIAIAERVLDDGADAAVVYCDDEPIHSDRLDSLVDRAMFVRVLETEETVADAAQKAITGDSGQQVFVYGFPDSLDVATDAIETAGGDAETAKVENFG